MEESGDIRFPSYLDPEAEEFRPQNPCPYSQITLLPPHIYYPCPSPYPPPPPPTLMPLYDGGGTGYRLRPTPSQPSVAVPPSAAPSRALLLTSVPTMVTEEMVRDELQVFGAVRAVEMERLGEGIVTVHFYDLRHAKAALVQIQEQHMQQQNRLRLHYCMQLPWENSSSSLVPVPPPGSGLIAGQAVWAQFTLPLTIPLPDGLNQGTIVVFNLDSGVSASMLKHIFEAFGTVKEVRETPFKQHQRFVEYFDTRDAARAIMEMNGKEINGKRLLIEFSRPGGQRRSFNTSTTFNRSNTNFFSRIPKSTPPSSPPTTQASSFPSKSFKRSNSDTSYASSSSSGKKSSTFSKGSGSRRGRCVVSTLTASLASLSVNGSENDNNFKGSSSSSSIKKHSKGNNKQQGKQQHQQQSKPNRSWKGRNKKLDSHFLIKEDALFESKWVKDNRTTVMIKNIPNKYSQKLLLNMLDNHCINCNEQIGDGDDQPLSSYDFVYLPIDFNNKCNVGYGFVNLTSPQATLRLYKAFHLQHWEVFNSRKICEITYARLQGLDALKEHFKNSKFACETDEYLPVLFDPPRDGKSLTDPIPIGGHNNTTGSSTSASFSSVHLLLNNGKPEDEDDDGLLHGDHDDEDDGEDHVDGDCDGHDGGCCQRSSRHLSSSSTSIITFAGITCGDGSTNGCMTCTESGGGPAAAQGFVSYSGY